MATRAVGLGIVAGVRIGELADTVGVSTKAIRYYESIGVLDEPERTTSGYRAYGQTAVERLEFVRQAQASGLSLTEIKSVLEIKDEGGQSCEHTIDLLEAHLADLERRIEELQRSRVELGDMLRRARRLDPANCTDPHRCQVIAATAEPV